jgi:hypothetical protein
MTSTPIFSSTNVSDVYKVYEVVHEAFLKQHKYQMDFGITTQTSDPNFTLNAHDANADERKWLEVKVSEVVEEKLKKSEKGS